VLLYEYAAYLFSNTCVSALSDSFTVNVVCGFDVYGVFFFIFFLNSVQHECIPQAILGMDILCQAKSGMGKTAVFVLATLQQIEPVDGQVSIVFKLN